VILGAYTFAWKPDQFTIPKAERRYATVETFASEVFFSYGTSILGKTVTLEWDWMSAAQFNALDALYQADLPVAWNLQVVGENIFTVEITKLDGELFEVVGYGFPHRRKVKMELLILAFSAGVMS
jgi:hypothetical protein